MGKMIRLTAPDGHEFDAYLAEPEGAPRGGLIVAMEMYGVNGYLTSVCDSYAKDSYLCIAPALFDRLQRDLTLPYDDVGNRRGKELSALNDFDRTIARTVIHNDQLSLNPGGANGCEHSPSKGSKVLSLVVGRDDDGNGGFWSWHIVHRSRIGRLDRTPKLQKRSSVLTNKLSLWRMGGAPNMQHEESTVAEDRHSFTVPEWWQR